MQSCLRGVVRSRDCWMVSGFELHSVSFELGRKGGRVGQRGQISAVRVRVNV